MKRHGVGTKILVTLVLALTLAVVLTMLLTQASTETHDRLGNASDEFQNRTEEQKEGLLEQIAGSIRDGIEAAGLIESETGP